MCPYVLVSLVGISRNDKGREFKVRMCCVLVMYCVVNWLCIVVRIGSDAVRVYAVKNADGR